MEEKSTPTFLKPAFIYGSILGLVVILILVVFYLLDILTIGWGQTVILYTIWFGILAFFMVLYRNKYLGGFASFGHLFYMAFYVGYISSVMNTIYTYLLYKVFDPGLVDKINLAAKEQFKERMINDASISESNIDVLIKETDMGANVHIMSISVLLYGILLSAIFGLIIAAIVKRKKNPVGTTK